MSRLKRELAVYTSLSHITAAGSIARLTQITAS